MRNTPLKAFVKKSPVEKNFDFSKQADYSKKATEGNFGARFAKFILPDDSITGLITSALPIKPLLKAGVKAVNYLTGKNNA